MLPAFIIAGAQRSGNTSLYHYLVEHPLVRPALAKEIHYFDLHFDRGLRWYRGHFPRQAGGPAGRRFLTGEASPYYLFHPHTVERLAAALPAVKVLVLLRNPVERAYSHYRHEVELGVEKLPCEEALEREGERLEGEVERLSLYFEPFNQELDELLGVTLGWEGS